MSDDLKQDTSIKTVKCEAATLHTQAVCGKPAIEAVVEHGDYLPVCGHHAMIARRNHWAIGRLRLNKKVSD